MTVSYFPQQELDILKDAMMPVPECMMKSEENEVGFIEVKFKL